VKTSIASGQITVFYLFDIAESIDLGALAQRLATATAAKFQHKAPAPPYVQYQRPPLVVDGDALGLPPLDGFAARFKFYSYGVVSLALTRAFSGSWVDLIAVSYTLVENDALEQRAEQLCRTVVDRIGPAAVGVKERYLAEDYLVFSLTKLDPPLSADELIATHGEEIALLLRGERQALSHQERDEILRNRVSYLASDLVVPTWNCALVYDNEVGVQAALDIFEFANSQLLEFRYYDELLELEMERIYADLQRPRWHAAFAGTRYTREARQLHSLYIDITELTDRTQNALKMVGDIYAARLFNLAASRLGLDRWKASVEDKLDTLDDIYRFTVEQTAVSRGNVLELIIVVILLFELALFFAGIMR
jgi:hypothetical protein